MHTPDVAESGDGAQYRRAAVARDNGCKGPLSEKLAGADSGPSRLEPRNRACDLAVLKPKDLPVGTSWSQPEASGALDPCLS
jgi:hypothetical protein